MACKFGGGGGGAWLSQVVLKEEVERRGVRRFLLTWRCALALSSAAASSFAEGGRKKFDDRCHDRGGGSCMKTPKKWEYLPFTLDRLSKFETWQHVVGGDATEPLSRANHGTEGARAGNFA